MPLNYSGCPMEIEDFNINDLWLPLYPKLHHPLVLQHLAL
jgi:hypothetical protein